jgi:hypothetical protein
MNLDVNTLFLVTIYVEAILGLLLLFAWVQSGLKWSSQHPDEGGCDEDSTAAFGSVWAGAIVVARSTLRGRTR